MAAVPEHCAPTTPFLADFSIYFHTCIPTPLAFLSTTLGILSIVSWLFAQLPQIYKNYQLQSTAGLSLFFLVEWCLGDATNLLGALFTRQAGWQVVVAGYYVFVDLCLVSQYLWYAFFKPQIYCGSLHSANSSDGGDADSDILNGLSPINSDFGLDRTITSNSDDVITKDSPKSRPVEAPRLANLNDEKATLFWGRSPMVRQRGDAALSWTPAPSPHTLIYIFAFCALLSTASASPLPATVTQLGYAHASQAMSSLEVAGTVLSWCSTGLYLGSRLPQLYKNWDRQSTAGLSPLLFMAAFSGNSFYSSSLLTNPNAWNDFQPYGGHGWVGSEGSARGAWVARAAPFWLGSAGVLALDGAMGAQFLLYGDREEEKIVKVKDSMGISRWQKVDGWMRGWVPSIKGKERLVAVDEGERLLSESRELQRSQYSYRSI